MGKLYDNTENVAHKLHRTCLFQCSKAFAMVHCYIMIHNFVLNMPLF